MTKSTVTTERLRQIASGNAFTCTQDDESVAMAAELLAVREARSIGFIQDRASGHDSYVLKAFYGANLNIGDKVYAAPPAPAVPAELLDAMAEVIRISDRDHEAWSRAKAAISACRAAMLQPVSQGYTFEGLNIRAVAALRESVRNQWLKSEEFADKIYWKNMHSIANEIIEAMAAAPTPTK